MQELQKVEGLGRLAFECHVPGAAYDKRFDIYLVDHALPIEVDGSHHFYGSHHGKPAWQQFDFDRGVDDAFKAAGQRLVRLHFQDGQGWAAIVQATIKSPGQEVVSYSKSYPKELKRRSMGLM